MQKGVGFLNNLTYDQNIAYFIKYENNIDYRELIRYFSKDKPTISNMMGIISNIVQNCPHDIDISLI